MQPRRSGPHRAKRLGSRLLLKANEYRSKPSNESGTVTGVRLYKLTNRLGLIEPLVGF